LWFPLPTLWLPPPTSCLPPPIPCLQPLLQTATATRQQFTSTRSPRRLLICSTLNSLRPPSVVLPCRRQIPENPIMPVTTITAHRTLNYIKNPCLRLKFPSVVLKSIIRPLAAHLKRPATSPQSTMNKSQTGCDKTIHWEMCLISIELNNEKHGRCFA